MVREEKARIMKRIKRIIAVIILSLVVLLVGYSCYTGSRLTDYPKEIDGYKNRTFYVNDGGMVVFKDDYAWYKTEKGIVLLTFECYQDGVIKMTRDGEDYFFLAIDEDMLYDERTKEFLTEGERDG